MDMLIGKDGALTFTGVDEGDSKANACEMMAAVFFSLVAREVRVLGASGPEALVVGIGVDCDEHSLYELYGILEQRYPDIRGMAVASAAKLVAERLVAA